MLPFETDPQLGYFTRGIDWLRGDLPQHVRHGRATILARRILHIGETLPVTSVDKPIIVSCQYSLGELNVTVDGEQRHYYGGHLEEIKTSVIFDDGFFGFSGVQEVFTEDGAVLSDDFVYVAGLPRPEQIGTEHFSSVLQSMSAAISAVRNGEQRVL